MKTLSQDLCYAIRTLRKSPGFTDNHLNTDINRRRWLTGSVALAAVGGTTTCSTGFPIVTWQ